MPSDACTDTHLSGTNRGVGLIVILDHWWEEQGGNLLFILRVQGMGQHIHGSHSKKRDEEIGEGPAQDNKTQVSEVAHAAAIFSDKTCSCVERKSCMSSCVVSIKSAWPAVYLDSQPAQAKGVLDGSSPPVPSSILRMPLIIVKKIVFDVSFSCPCQKV